MQINKVLDSVVNLQKINPQLLLCGSAALMIAEALPQRIPGDLDFVINKRDLPFIKDITGLREDKYPTNEGDNYKSYHGTWRPYMFARSFSVNLLVFDDEVVLNSETIVCRKECVTVQKVDDILRWKEKYNRPKDIEDLNKITTKAIEETLLS